MRSYPGRKIRIAPTVLAVSLMTGLMLSSVFAGPGAAFAKSSTEAAILVCSTSGTDAIIVQNYSGSAGAPGIAVGTSCAVAIATLLTAKFETTSVAPGDLRGGFYFFVK